MTDIDGQLTDLPTAAARLGLSSDAVRKRIVRGLLPGKKLSGRWYALLPPLADPPDIDGHVRHVTDMALIDELREQNRRLWERLEAAEVAQAELRRLLLQAGGRLELPTPQPPAPNAPPARQDEAQPAAPAFRDVLGVVRRWLRGRG